MNVSQIYFTQTQSNLSLPSITSVSSCQRPGDSAFYASSLTAITHDTISSNNDSDDSSSSSLKIARQRKRTRAACVFCKEKHLACSGMRPCQNCTKRKLPARCCVDAPRKRSSLKMQNNTDLNASVDHSSFASDESVCDTDLSLTDSPVDDILFAIETGNISKTVDRSYYSNNDTMKYQNYAYPYDTTPYIHFAPEPQQLHRLEPQATRKVGGFHRVNYPPSSHRMRIDYILNDWTI
jgi:hypothetical protein